MKKIYISNKPTKLSKPEITISLEEATRRLVKRGIITTLTGNEQLLSKRIYPSIK